MKNIKSNDYYETTDLALASFLFASRCASIVDIKINFRGKKTFVFFPCPPEQVISGFYNGSEMVSALSLIEAYQILKVAYVLKSNGG
jgi:hypothetical protein